MTNALPAAALHPVDADPRQTFRAGAVPAQPSTSGPAGQQSWRPSPSFRQQQEQLHQAVVPGVTHISVKTDHPCTD